MLEGLTLAELADASGLQPRTIRSWVAQGLLPGPLSRGPGARYPVDQLERILAIRTMKELHGMSLADIRQELLVAPAERVAALAQRARTIAPEAAATSPHDPSSQQVADKGTAFEYFRGLRARTQTPIVRESTAPYSLSASFHADADAPPPEPPGRPATGFEALEQRLMLGASRASRERRTRAEERLTIEITPDVELSVRGKLDAEQRARLERCAELIRDILTGRE